jgi:CPA1 family monovalent cation:H+ antiporter
MNFYLFFLIGGPLFGLFCGFICVFILNRINNELKIEITITFSITYLVFYIADAELNFSAVLALIFMGLYMAKYKYCISSNVQSSMAGAWQIIIFIVNILTFTLSGLILAHSFVGVETNVTSRDIGISLVLYLLIHVSRVLIVSVLHPVITWSGIFLNRKECVVYAWSGLRGRTALILVLLIYLDTKIDRATRERFLFHISMIVLYTFVINGTSSKFLVKMLGLHKGRISFNHLKKGFSEF